MMMAHHGATAAHPGHSRHRPLSQRVIIESLLTTLMLAGALWALLTFAFDSPGYGEEDHFVTYGINSAADPVQKQSSVFHSTFGTSSGAEVSLFSDMAYSVSAKVESVTAYDDVMGEFMTYDLLLAWGELADADVDSKLTWEQSDRRGTVSGSLEATGRDIDAAYVISHVSNSHVIAADNNIAAALATIKAGDVVRIEGRLVDIRMIDGNQLYTVASSKSRTDQGDGACEIILVERVRINEQTWG
ncbi:MAG: hypothetical protein C4534_10540 [Gaiellales bacterium]|nr:MAG: hypothetical protein C4534_10540 [Gaiellales bacterium]